MNTSRLIIAVLSVATAGLAWYSFGQHHRAQSAAISSQEKIASLEAKIAALEKAATTAHPTPLSPQFPTGTNLKGPMPVPSGAPSAGLPGSMSGGPSAGPSAMNSGPEIAKLIALQQRAVLDSRYASLFRILKLNPADLDALKTLLVDKQSAAYDVRSAMQAQGINPRDGREMAGELLAQAQNEADESIRKLLGDAAFSKFKLYEQTLPERALVTQLEQRLSYSSHPMNSDQAERLIGVLAETGGKPTIQISGATFARNGPVAAPTITADMLTRSQGILDSEQMAALRQLQAEQETRNQFSQKLRNSGGPMPGGFAPRSP